MCPQLRHHESAKIRLEAQRQTQGNVSSVSFGEHKREERQVNSLWLWRQSASRVESRQKPTGGWLVTKSWLLWIIKRTSYWAECYHDKIVPVFVSLSGRHVSIIFSIEIIIFHYPLSSLLCLTTTRDRPICNCWAAPSTELHYLKVILWLLCIL